MRAIFTCCLLISCLVVSAQTDFNLYLKSGIERAAALPGPEEIPLENLRIARYNGYYYAVLQFGSVLDVSGRAALKNQGVELFRYIPNYAYVGRFPDDLDPRSLPVRSIFVLNAIHKLDPGFTGQAPFPSHAVEARGVSLFITSFPNVDSTQVLNELRSFDPAVVFETGVYKLTVPSSQLTALASLPMILYVEPSTPDPQTEGVEARGQQRLNGLLRPDGGALTGKGVRMAIGDDGSVDHLDLAGRVTDFVGESGGRHGDMTVGIAAGAGNLNPLAMGMAPEAEIDLYPIKGYKHIFSAPSNYLQRQVVITSTSYRDGCGGTYTTGAQFVDDQVNDFPDLLHVFSAGNDAANPCSNSYGKVLTGSGQFYGTITGGMKAAKNVLSIGNVDGDDLLNATSSWGPSADGRIKPELCAKGEGNFTTDEENGYQNGSGTSAAAPSVAGTATLFYEFYRQQHFGENPPVALLKALFLNGADDLYLPGPDYRTGWGRINARRSMEMLKNQQFRLGSVGHNRSQSHQISVPSGVANIKVMLVWTDPAASILTNKALVNDLDLVLRDPGGAQVLPWRLSSAAHLDSLNSPAQRGRDRVNNVEQVSITTPKPGTYTIQVEGTNVPLGPQSYYVVYSFEREGITITRPAGGESLLPGEPATIYWDAVGNTGEFTLEYSINNGSTWNPIAQRVAGNLRSYEWLVPKVFTGRGKIRIRRGNSRAESPSTFSIVESPIPEITFINNNTARMSWKAVPGADTYEIYRMGEQRMELIGNASNPQFDLTGLVPWEEQWYAIRARNNRTGMLGMRSRATSYIHKSCETSVKIRLQFDRYPGDIYWELVNEEAIVLASGGGYGGELANQLIEIEECVPSGCVEFRIEDRFSDGLCCANGQGYYEVLNDDEQVVRRGTQFSMETTTICQNVDSDLEANLNVDTTILCAGEQSGALSVLVSGGSGNYTYQWNTGATGPKLTGLGSGPYSVTVSDGNVEVVLMVILEEPAPLEGEIQYRNNACADLLDSEAFVNIGGGQPPYNYQWSNGSRTNLIQNMAPGTYSVTVTDANGCTWTESVDIFSPAPLNLRLTKQDVDCFGESTGRLQADVKGGAGGYSFRWSNGSRAAVNSNLSADVYSLTVTDANQCTVIAMERITQPSPLLISFPEEETNCEAATVDIAPQVKGGEQPYQYLWNTGATSPELVQVPAGTYSLTVTDANGCVKTATHSSVTGKELSLQISGSDVSCPGGMDGSARVDILSGIPPFNFEWETGATSSRISGLSRGWYRVTVTDAQACPRVDSIRIDAPDELYFRAEILHPICAGETGSIILNPIGGTPPYNYQWPDGSTGPILDNLNPDAYDLTITDAAGCTKDTTIVLESPSTIQVEKNSQPVSCFGEADGVISLLVSGGVTPINVLWGDGESGIQRSGLLADLYHFTITDANACTVEDSVEIQSPEELELVADIQAISCHDEQDGGIAITPQEGLAPYAYVWENGAATSSRTGLGSGNYSVTVTDANGCTASQSFSLSRPAALSLNSSIQEISCAGQNDGGIQVIAGGGFPPYAFQWSSGQTSSQLENLGEGEYTLTLTDTAGCSMVETYSLSDPLPLSYDIESNDPNCEGGFDGRIRVTPKEGSGPYMIEWSTGQTGMEISGLQEGNYAFTLTDSRSCSQIGLLTLTDPKGMEISISVTEASNGDDGALSLMVENGTPPYSYLWSTGSRERDISDLEPGMYTVTVTDSNGCQASAAATIPGDGSAGYCEVGHQSTEFEWIEQVQFGSQNFRSGNDNGYGDYSNEVFTLQSGASNAFVLSPGQRLVNTPENWYIWIDYNRDGDFDDPGELVYQKSSHPGNLSDAFETPLVGNTYQTRMRIAMRYLANDLPCGNLPYGEAEDYTVRLTEGVAYCNAFGSESRFEWIKRVSIDGQKFETGNDNGYRDYTATEIPLQAGASVPVELEVGLRGSARDEGWSVWADWNQDAVFQSNELVFTRVSDQTVLKFDLSIPSNVEPGKVRLRISLQWGAANTDPCAMIFYGEVEDYTLQIGNSPSVKQPTFSPAVNPGGGPLEYDLILFPNPGKGPVQVSIVTTLTEESIDFLSVLDLRGRIVHKEQLWVYPGENNWSLDLSHLPNGPYQILLGNQSKRWIKQ